MVISRLSAPSAGGRVLEIHKRANRSLAIQRLLARWMRSRAIHDPMPCQPCQPTTWKTSCSSCGFLPLRSLPPSKYPLPCVRSSSHLATNKRKFVTATEGGAPSRARQAGGRRLRKHRGRSPMFESNGAGRPAPSRRNSRSCVNREQKDVVFWSRRVWLGRSPPQSGRMVS